jgi:photosystem II stability/assembly factor-like uncharacterized protein
MSQKRFIFIFIVLIVLFASIVIVTQLNARNQIPQSVNLKSVAMISATDGWAVGETGQNNPVILHYDGKQWTTTNNFLLDQHMRLSSIGMVSATEGWIVGETSLPLSNGSSQSTSVGIIFHYLQGTWSIASGSIVPPALRSLFILSADDIWTVGDEGTILHYDGVQWNEITSSAIDNTFSLTAVTATSKHNVWVTGSLGVLLHYDGTTWTRITASIFDAGANLPNLLSISMSSTYDGWIVGNRAHSSNGLIFHYHNGKWQEIQTTALTHLQSVLMISTTDGWAVGDAGTILHYTNHLWTQVENAPATPDALLAGISFTSAQDGWAVGDKGAMLHYQNGLWSTLIETSSD